ncbi:hypothetical protein [Shewanella sp.]|uniref:hypothetical protein n=3 Tax=Shewanella sp. TaxID=50422 RepID=UPI0040545118
MEGNKLVLVGLTLSLLTACGGGSGGDNNSASVIVETIKGRVINETTCGNQSYPGVEVLVHDNAGKIVKRVKNTDDGEFSVSWDKGDTHISFVKNGVNLHAKTLLNVSAGDLGLIPLKSDATTNCDCTYVNFDTSEIAPLYPNTQLLPSSSNVKVCKVEGKYQSINLALVPTQDGVAPIATSIDVNNLINGQAILLKAEDFNGEYRQGQAITLDGLVSGDHLSTGSVSNRQSDADQQFSWQQSAYAFPQQFGEEYVSASHTQFHNLPNGTSIFYLSAHTQQIHDANKIYNAEINRDFAPLLEALQPVLEGVAANQATSYDFSQYDANISAVNFELGSQAWDWSIEGAKSGTLPLIELPTDAVHKINLSTSFNSSLGLILVESKNSTSYADFRQEWAKVSRDNYFLTDAKVSILHISGKI